MATTKLSRTQKANINYFKRLENNFQQVHLKKYGVPEVIASWPHMTLTYTNGKKSVGSGDNYKWANAWLGVIFDPIQLARLTGLREQVLFALDICIGNKLIYPDGTVSKNIYDHLQIPYSDSDTLLAQVLIEKG